MRHVDQKAAASFVEEAAKKFRLAHLCVLYREKAGNVFHHQRRRYGIAQHARIGDKTAQEIFGVERRKNIIQRATTILGVDALEMLCHPRGSVIILQSPRSLQRWLA